MKLSMNLLIGLMAVLLLLSGCAELDQTRIVIEPETMEEGQATTGQVVGADDAMVTDAPVGPARGVADGGDVLITASSLTDYNFENRDGEVTGDIEDVIVDLESGDVLYVMIEYGGFLDIGDKEVPMPLSAFVWTPDGRLILNFDEQALENFPDLGDDWFDPTLADWDNTANDFWRGIGIDPGFDYVEPSDSITEIDDVIGFDITDIGLGVGNVEDMLIDMGESRIEYMLLVYDPNLFNDELVVVPFGAFDITSQSDEFYFQPDIDATALENAPRFGRNALSVGEDASTIAGADTYWRELGYNPIDMREEDDLGQEMLDSELTDEAAMVDSAAVGVTGLEGNLVRASDMLDFDVNNLSGEEIGEIEDILINVENGNLLFATLEYGGFLDLGDREIPVALNAFGWAGDDDLTLNIDEQQMDALPDLSDDWPTVTDDAWNDDVAGFWSDLGVNPGYGVTDADTVMYMSNLIGFSLGDLNLGTDGAIHDILIDPSASQAAHVIMDFGGLFDNDFIALPFSAVDVTITDSGFLFTPNVEADLLQNAPRINRDIFDDTTLFDAGFDDEIVIYWRDAGY